MQGSKKNIHHFLLLHQKYSQTFMKVNPQITELHHTRLTLLTQILMEKGA
jgi:hypothetical protein